MIIKAKVLIHEKDLGVSPNNLKITEKDIIETKDCKFYIWHRNKVIEVEPTETGLSFRAIAVQENVRKIIEAGEWYEI